MTRAAPGLRRCGAILLEAVIAVAILFMGAVTITGAVNQAIRSMERSRFELRAADLARSAMAEIEAGISTPESLNGPVKEGKGGEGGWNLDVEVTPSPFRGLAAISIRALRGDPGAESVSFTLRQLVRLTDRGEDAAGQAGELAVESQRAIEQAPGRGTGGTP